jgi:2-polyprenyl-6-methoxyphenol hydroxylase-like FAD-dependent oxidoreductase
VRIRIVGGGPAGLFFASLMKRDDPSHDIRVVERDPEGATYGWGVVLSDVALNFVKDVDATLHAALTRGQVVFDRLRIVHQGVEVVLENNTFYRMARLELLRTLHQHCREGGVAIEFGRRVTSLSELGECDLIVGADGANSTVRGLLADRFQPSLDVRPNHFAWYGTPRLFDALSLVFRPHADGLLIAHAYRYSPTLSTFIVETDRGTFHRAGLDTLSETESLRYCQHAFADDLAGAPLLSNRSTWFNYAIVRNRHWHHGNVVLLGDALRTGHPSIGSGTRLAMQDAIALLRAFQARGTDVPAALAEFERIRRPGSDELQTAAVRSAEWYETVRDRLHLHPVAFAYDYMRRTGRVSHEDLRRRNPDLVAAREALPGAG